MDQCDASRVAEIEKAVVEQAHCYLPPRGEGFRVPVGFKTDPIDPGVIVVLFLVAATGYVLGRING